MSNISPSPEPEDAQWMRRALLQRLESLRRSGLSILPKMDLATPVPATHTPPKQTAPAAVASPPPRMMPVVNTPEPAPVSRPAVVASPSSTKPPPTLATNSPVVEGVTARQESVVRSPGEIQVGELFTNLPPSDPDQRKVTLQVLREEVAGCTCCSELASTRTQTVFGVGSIQPRLCFFGEAPGADEDASGEPFVGRAGQLLTDIITKGMNMRREDVFILNVLKCRPPGNRPPADTEVANCRHFFERQLEILRPEFICCLGASAAKALLNTTFSIGKLRGRFYDYRGAKVLATYHPAYLLRNPGAKKDVWEDIKILLKEMGLPVK